jgi:hypothetical protein
MESKHMRGFTTRDHRATAQPGRGILFFLVAGYVALLPYLFEAGDHINFAPADCFLFLVICLAPAQLGYRRHAWTFWHLAILLTFALGSLVAVLRFGSLDRYELLNKDDLRCILRVFTLSVVAENLLAIGGFLAAYFFGITTPFTRYEGLRLSGMLLDPNAYGGLLVVALVICEAASSGEAPLFKQPTLWFSRLTLALGILFTFSRSAWTGLAVAFLLLALIRPALAFRPILACLCATPCFALLVGPRFIPIFEQMAARPKQVHERFDLIREAWEAFVLHPLLGGGLGSFRLGAGIVAHNSAMWFLADFGLVGFAVLLAFLWWFFAKAWHVYRFAPLVQRPLGLALFLAHAAMVGVAMGIEAFYQRFWWLVMALIASGYSLVLDQGAACRGTEPLARTQ